MPFPKTAGPIVALLSLCAAPSLAGQADPSALRSSAISTRVPVLLPVLHDETEARRLGEIRQWTREYEEWRAWFARWHNRRQPGWLSARARKPRPVPPEWLPSLCAAVVEDTGPRADACRAWQEWERGELAVLAAARRAETRLQAERPEKTSWWQHVHVDAIWPMTQSGSHAFGVAGMHATMPVSKRAQVFVAPGMILMRLPSGDGGQRWSAATDWGFSYRLFDFKMPGLDRPSTLHFNAARVWLLGQPVVSLSQDLYLAGFSVTFKPRMRDKSGR